jgi:DNA-directed RNA polymerase subunit N (RpoN/RPB10)
MIYLTCPTCGFFLGSKTIEFETKKQEICSNPNLNEEQKSAEISKMVKTLGLRRYCCIMRLITTKDIVQDILPVNA